ncbi:tetratricopeptide repeat protein [Mucilaginibacter sp. RB4R14]|uniref:tetratricopeptide repeat protein n=1 Tax=Mucilaginibacter aurantiaciroseus TaxID=2949308 RepID=UPI0020917D3F|nr:tetratricopeptide repeat protein [Mucilaginibacter aurantiaciroseus]MCO5936823.1 tetratricopeptide repeat protein [Mucilaginibacter aurantiaciroseus]
MKVKQIVVGVAVVAIMGYLYSLPVKGLSQAKAATRGQAAAGAAPMVKANANINVATVSASAKVNIDASVAKQISTLENKLKTAGDADKATLERQIAKIWASVAQPAPAAFYYLDIAHKSNAIADWLDAGKGFNAAYKLSQDTSAQGTYIVNAVDAFKNAIKLQPASLEAKTGLGVAYVNGGAMPMQGIALLLDVVKQDPNNHDALLNLGMFAMKSGQYEKAVERFKTLIAQKEELEPYFYLAESYKQLGKKKEAIAAYEKCKDIMGDPSAGQRIDEYIKELKK